MERSPTSVIIPVRNGADLIAEAIESVLAELADEDEVIVIDDASTDRTREIVQANPDPRIRLLSGGGRGVSAARNAGLAAARGELIAFLDHDDIWPAGRHAAMAGALDGNPDIDGVFGRMRVRFLPDAPFDSRIAALDGKHVGIVSVGTGLFRRRIVDLVSGFDEGLTFGEDTDFYLRLLEAGMRIETIDVDALTYRRHASNVTNDVQSMQLGLNDVLMRRIQRMRAPKPAG